MRLMVPKGSTYVEVIVQHTGKIGDEMLNAAKQPIAEEQTSALTGGVDLAREWIPRAAMSPAAVEPVTEDDF